MVATPLASRVSRSARNTQSVPPEGQGTPSGTGSPPPPPPSSIHAALYSLFPLPIVPSSLRGMALPLAPFPPSAALCPLRFVP